MRITIESSLVNSLWWLGVGGKADRQTGRQTDRQTDGDRQTETDRRRQTDGEMTGAFTYPDAQPQFFHLVLSSLSAIFTVTSIVASIRLTPFFIFP